MEHATCSFGSELILPVSKNKVCLKGTKISGFEDIQKNLKKALKLIHDRSSKNVSYSCSIVRQIA
jgi:hypothetical protein